MPGPWEDYAPQAPQAAPQPPGPWDEYAPPSTLEDIAKAIPAGLARGVTALAGLPGDLQSLANAGVEKLLGPPPTPPPPEEGSAAAYIESLPFAKGAPTTPEITGGLERNITGPLYQPQTTGGEFANTISSFVPGAAIGGIGGIMRRLITQAALPGIGSEAAGQATKGSPYEKWSRLAGALAGGAAPGVMARAVTPLPITAERQAANQALIDRGITPLAGQATGREGLQAFESEVGGQQGRQLLEEQKQAVNREALSTVGVNAAHADPPTIAHAIRQNSNEFNRLVAANNVTVSTPLMRDIMAAHRDYVRNTANHFQVPVAQNVLTDISQEMARHGYLRGRWYQNMRSDIGNAARSAMSRGGSGSEAQALLRMQRALDDAMEQSIAATNSADLGAFRDVRRQYANLQHIVHSVTGKSGAGGNVDLERLRSSQAAWDEAGYASGRGDLNLLTHAGQEVLKPYPNSGTAARTAARNIVPTATATAGGLLGHSLAPGGPGAAAGVLAGAAIPYLARTAAGRAVTTPGVQQYLRNQALAGPATNLGGDPWRTALIQALMGPQKVPLQIMMGPPTLPPTQ